MKKFYLIDNNIIYLASLESQLRSKNFDVFSDSGEEDILFTYREILLKKPDIIIMDLVLPAFEGLALLHKLKENEHTHNIPVTIYTNSSYKCLKEPSQNKGVNHFYFKEEYEPERLIDSINKIFMRNKVEI